MKSRHAACRSSTNAWPSGLRLPSRPNEYGFTTGVSQPSAVKCARPVVPEEVEEGAGAVLVDEGEPEDEDEEEEEEDEEEDDDDEEEEY